MMDRHKKTQPAVQKDVYGVQSNALTEISACTSILILVAYLKVFFWVRRRELHLLQGNG